MKGNSILYSTRGAKFEFDSFIYGEEGAPFRGKAAAVEELRIHFIGDVKRESKRDDSEEKIYIYRCIFNLLFYDSFRYESSYRAEGVNLLFMFIPFEIFAVMKHDLQ